MNRRRIIIGLFASVTSIRAAAANDPNPVVNVYRSPGCGCCKGWADHLGKAGFATILIELDDLAETKRRAGVPAAFEACHTALVEGYFVEGHVPAADIRRLLAERPKARGLAVPGMPVGSPGMEVAGVAAERFETLLIALDGSPRTFASH